MKKLQKLDFLTFQFFHARGDISEMQQSTLADWCDLNTEAKKELSIRRQAAVRLPIWERTTAFFDS